MKKFVRSLCCLMLCAEIAIGPAAIRPVVAKAYSENPQPYWLHVSRTAQIVTAHSTVDDSVVRQMICSTGKAGSPTITGRFRMPAPRSDERKNWYAFGPSTWAHYASRIKGSYLFHSILYSSPATSSLKRATWSAIGSRDSAGCVRMTPLDAQWIAYNCPEGTVVVINDSKPKGPITSSSTIKRTLPAAQSNGVLPGYEPNLKPTPRPEAPTLAIGIVGPRTKTMQSILRSLGYYTGSVDGTFNEATGIALTQFQERHLELNPTSDLIADGKATPAWQTVIYDNKLNRAYTTTHRPLKEGSVGASVYIMREMLYAYHYTSALPTTKFDARTKTAVANAQRAFGLAVTGEATKELQDLLLSKDGKPLPIARVSNHSGLTLRKTPSTQGTAVVKVKFDAQLAVVKNEGEWSYVATGTYGGYVQTQYITYEVASETPADR